MMKMNILEEYTSSSKDIPVTDMEGNEYHLQDRLLYKLDKLCIPHSIRI
jgi:hypothetical protein